MHGLHSRVRATRLVECIVPATSTWQITCTLYIEMCLFACVSVCVSGIVGYYLQLYQSPRGPLQTHVSTDGLVPFLTEARSANAPVRFPYSWTTVPPRTNLTLVPFNVLTSGKPGWCTWNTSRFARPWRKLTPFLTILHVMEVKTPSVHIVLSYLHAKLSTCVNRYSMLVPMVHLNTI